MIIKDYIEKKRKQERNEKIKETFGLATLAAGIIFACPYRFNVKGRHNIEVTALTWKLHVRERMLPHDDPDYINKHKTHVATVSLSFFPPVK